MNIGLQNKEEVLKEIIIQNIEGIKINTIQKNILRNFDIMVLTKEEDINTKNLQCKYLLIDGDLSLSFISNVKNKVKANYILTFGSNNKCTITFSSIYTDDKAQYQVCVQRCFESFNNEKILQQEFPILCYNKNVNSNKVLLICTIMLLLNKSIKNII